MLSEKIVEGVHYIGLAADFGDLAEKTSLILSNKKKDLQHLNRIAINAKRLLRTVTYPEVVSEVANVLLRASSATF